MSNAFKVSVASLLGGPIALLGAFILFAGNPNAKWTGVLMLLIGGVPLALVVSSALRKRRTIEKVSPTQPVASGAPQTQAANFSSQSLTPKQIFVTVAGVLLIGGVGAWLTTGTSGIGTNAALDAASQLVMADLRSPSSFTLVAAETLWSGKDSAGKDAYVIRVDYDAQNGFGAMLRGCETVAFTLNGGKIEWKPLYAKNDCTGAGPEVTRNSEFLATLRKYNFEG